jgi:Ca2+-binding EF-hand superfamily protein
MIVGSPTRRVGAPAYGGYPIGTAPMAMGARPMTMGARPFGMPSGSIYRAQPAPAMGFHRAATVPVNTQSNKEHIEKITELVKHGSDLKPMIDDIFAECHPGNGMLNFSEFMKFIQKTSSKIGIPPAALGNAQDDFERYDFDGDGGLEAHECYRLVKEHLKTYRKKIGHFHSDTNMPRKTLEQAHLKLGKELGHGSFGTVFLCTDKDGDTKCVKKMDKSKMQGAGLEELAEEFEMMHEMSNNHIAKTFELFQDSVAYYIVNEPYYGGDLSKIRHKCEKHGVKLTDEYWKEVFKQCF